jgi:hypothetical protein
VANDAVRQFVFRAIGDAGNCIRWQTCSTLDLIAVTDVALDQTGTDRKAFAAD